MMESLLFFVTLKIVVTCLISYYSLRYKLIIIMVALIYLNFSCCFICFETFQICLYFLKFVFCCVYGSFIVYWYK
jgi:hypothetical protein